MVARAGEASIRTQPGREAGRKGGGRLVSVSATRCKCPLCPPALQLWALGDGFFRRLTRASRGLSLLPGPCFNGCFSPVINYSSVWPDLVSNNSSHFEMQVGVLFCFTFLFLLTFGEMEVLFSVVKPRSLFIYLFHSYTHNSSSCLLFEESFLLKLQSTWLPLAIYPQMLGQ